MYLYRRHIIRYYKIFAHYDVFIWIYDNMTMCLWPVRTPKLSRFSGVWIMHGTIGSYRKYARFFLGYPSCCHGLPKTIESFSSHSQAPNNKFVIASLNCSGVRERSWDPGTSAEVVVVSGSQNGRFTRTNMVWQKGHCFLMFSGLPFLGNDSQP